MGVREGLVEVVRGRVSRGGGVGNDEAGKNSPIAKGLPKVWRGRVADKRYSRSLHHLFAMRTPEGC